MISVEDALGLVSAHLPTWGEDQQKITELCSNVTAVDLVADRDYPPFHRVMMDGIAVAWSSYESGQRLFSIHGVSPAGTGALHLIDPKSCFEVMTGAPLPVGADLVIPYEHVELEGNFARVIMEQERVKLEHVHLAGSDCKAGDVLLSAGSRLNGPHWGIAASLGYTEIECHRKPRVMIISTGDELVDVAEMPLEHQIRRSNAYALKSSLMVHGYQDVELDHLADDPLEISLHYKKNVDLYDFLIYSGGVSKGKFDYLPSVWKDLGVTTHFHGVAQRPGKPLFFGVDHKYKTAVVGLPGNPVSSLVCLHRYFLASRPMYAKLDQEIVFKKDLTFFVPVKVHFEKDGSLVATPVAIKNSGEFSALAGSDGFIELPQDQDVFKKGEAFLFVPWGRL